MLKLRASKALKQDEYSFQMEVIRVKQHLLIPLFVGSPWRKPIAFMASILAASAFRIQELKSIKRNGISKERQQIVESTMLNTLLHKPWTQRVWLMHYNKCGANRRCIVEPTSYDIPISEFSTTWTRLKQPVNSTSQRSWQGVNKMKTRVPTITKVIMQGINCIAPFAIHSPINANMQWKFIMRNRGKDV